MSCTAHTVMHTAAGTMLLAFKLYRVKPADSTHPITHSAISNKVLHNCWDLPQQSCYKTKCLF